MRQAPLLTAAPVLLLMSLSSCAVNSTARREKTSGSVPVSSVAAASASISPTASTSPHPSPAAAVPALPALPAHTPSLAAATMVDPGEFEKSSLALKEPFPEKPDSFFDKDRTTVSGSISVAVGYEKTSYPRVNRIGRNPAYGYGSAVMGPP